MKAETFFLGRFRARALARAARRKQRPHTHDPGQARMMLRAICAAALSPTKLMQPFSPIAGRRAVISACEDPEELWDEELEAMEHLRVLGARASQIAEVKKILRPEVQRLRDNPATEEATF